MEEFAIDLRGPAVDVVEGLSFRERVAAYAELTKPRITFLIVLTSAAGFALASPGSLDYLALLRALVGIGLLSSGIATLNQYAERDLDALMRRTASRPLPAGKLAPWEALAFGAGITILSEVYLLILVNPLTALLGLTVIVVYTVMLLPVSLLPAAMGTSGKIYFVGAIVLGLLFLHSSLRAAFSRSRQQARRLLLASVLYLPLLFILMVLDK